MTFWKSITLSGNSTLAMLSGAVVSLRQSLDWLNKPSLKPLARQN